MVISKLKKIIIDWRKVPIKGQDLYLEATTIQGGKAYIKIKLK